MEGRDEGVDVIRKGELKATLIQYSFLIVEYRLLELLPWRLQVGCRKHLMVKFASGLLICVPWHGFKDPHLEVLGRLFIINNIMGAHAHVFWKEAC